MFFVFCFLFFVVFYFVSRFSGLFIIDSPLGFLKRLFVVNKISYFKRASKGCYNYFAMFRCDVDEMKILKDIIAQR